MTVFNLGLGNIAAVNALNGKLSAVANLSGLANRQGIVSVVFNFSAQITTPGGKWRLQQSLDGVTFDDVRDNEGAAIEITFPTVATTASYIATFVNVHTSYIRIRGSQNGTNGTISKIQILAK